MQRGLNYRLLEKDPDILGKLSYWAETNNVQVDVYIQDIIIRVPESLFDEFIFLWGKYVVPAFDK